MRRKNGRPAIPEGVDQQIIMSRLLPLDLLVDPLWNSWSTPKSAQNAAQKR
jgi:hypothetical protein